MATAPTSAETFAASQAEFWAAYGRTWQETAERMKAGMTALTTALSEASATLFAETDEPS